MYRKCEPTGNWNPRPREGQCVREVLVTAREKVEFDILLSE